MSRMGEYISGIGLGLGVLALGAYMMAQGAKPSPEQHLALVNANGHIMEDLVRNCDPNDELSDENGRVWRAATVQRAQGGKTSKNGQYFVTVSPTVASLVNPENVDEDGKYKGLPDGCDVVPGSRIDVTKVSDIEERIAELYNNR